MPSEAEASGISRATRLPQWLDLKVIEYCRSHKLMQSVTDSEGKKISIPNISEGIKRILIEQFEKKEKKK